MAAGIIIPVWNTVSDSFDFVISNRSAFARIAAIPFLGLLVCAVPDIYFPSATGGIMTNVLIALILSVFAVKWHRFYLLGPDATTPSIGVRFGGREVRFFVYTVLFQGLYWVLEFVQVRETSGVGLTVALLLLPLLCVISVYLTGCFALAFPATAVDFSEGFIATIGWSWKITRGNAFRIGGALAVASVLIFLPVFLVVGFVLMVFSLWNELVITLVMTPVMAALQIVAGGICVTVASIAFDRLSGWRNEFMALGRA